MNFKLLFILFSLYGCGVKSVPRVQQEQAINSYIQEYTGVPEDSKETTKESKEEESKKKKEDKTKTAQ